MLRSFAFAQDDASEQCGAGKAKRAERSGLPVKLSVSETSHFSKRFPCGDPSLTLRMTVLTFFVAMTKKLTIKFKDDDHHLLFRTLLIIDHF